MPAEARYIVGVDFGTTSSGIAYFYSPANRSTPIDFANVTVIESWRPGRGIPKVPSRIAYDRNTGNITYGFEAVDAADGLGVLKILLLEPDDVPAHAMNLPGLEQSRFQLRKLCKTAVEVVADFLREIWKKFLADIERHADQRDPLGTAPLDVILTVPAIWPEYYRDRLEQAARLAGILDTREGLRETTLRFITEPEAAAYKTVQDQEFRGVLKIKDTFMVLDCGGATIDVITYQVVRTHPLVVKEAVPGDGSLHGGCILDALFLNALQMKFHRRDLWTKVDQDKRGLRKTLDIEWEGKIKGDFDGTDDFEFEPLWKVQAPVLTFGAYELRNIFDPCMNGIIDIAKSQVNALTTKGLPSVKFIKLAGGFGRSRYLLHCLQKSFPENPDMKIAQSDGVEPWIAIVRGAVLFGLTGKSLVQSRALRDGFALKHSPEFEDDEHDPEDIARDKLRKTMVAKDQLLWFFEKGEDVKHGGARDYSFDFAWPPSEKGHREWNEPLYRSGTEKPSVRYSVAQDSDSTFVEHATMRFKTPVPIEELPLRRGARYLDYKLRVEAVSGKVVKLTAVWDQDGTVIGTTEMPVRNE